MECIISERLATLPISLLTSLSGVTKATAVTVMIDGEPVAKGRPRHTRQGRCYTPEKTVQAERRVRQAVTGQLGRPLMAGPLAVEMLAISGVPKSWSGKKQRAALAGELRPDRKPDFDNLAKLYCDALNGILWEDDKQIVDGRCIKVYGELPGVVIWCWPL